MTLIDVVDFARSPSCRGRDFWRSPLHFGKVLLLIIAATFLLPTAQADEVRVDMRTATEAANQSMEIDPFVSVFRTESPVATRMRRYYRDVRNRWVVPEVRTRSSNYDAGPVTYVPLTLNTPDGEIQIELSVLVNGQSTHEVLKQLIQRAMTEASNPAASNPAASNPDASNDQEVSQENTASSPEIEISEESKEMELKNEEVGGAATEEAVGVNLETKIPEGVRPKRYQRDTAVAKLANFLSRSGDDQADEEELEWMLDQWRPGSIWLIDRASVSPPQLPLESLAVYLDQDHDASFSFLEIDALMSRFDRVDLDRDRIITQIEMDAAANQIRQNKYFPAPRLDWSLAWDKDASDVKVKTTSPPRAKLIVTAELNPTGGQLSLTGTDSGTLTRYQNYASITLTDAVAPTTVTFSGYFDSTLSENARVQTSIAATVSPNPIWSLIDINGDGRLGEPERLAVAARLKQLDSDGNMAVSAQEIPKHFAIIVCQGNAAVEKTNVASAFPPHQTSENTGVPAWFRSMDTNRDNAISRTEFLGGGKAFKTHDQDNNGLITSEELQLASKNDNQNEAKE